MTYTEILHQQVEQLPLNYQAEASRYLEFLLQKVGVAKSSVNEATEKDNSQKTLALMNEIASRGTAFADIDDVMAWQKEVRQDRPLPFRD